MRGGGSSRRIDSAVTDLPEPDSPTIASVRPAPDRKRNASDRGEFRAALPEGDAQIVHIEKRCLAHAIVFRGSKASRTASPMKISSESMMAMTKKPVRPSQGA